MDKWENRTGWWCGKTKRNRFLTRVLTGDFSWFSSVSQTNICTVSDLSTTASIHIFSNSLIINHSIVHSLKHSTHRLFQITNLMHNSFIFQQYVCYTTLLNMFRAARCSSSGGPIVSPQPLVSSPSVSSRTVCRWVRSSPAYCTAAYHRIINFVVYFQL